MKKINKFWLNLLLQTNIGLLLVLFLACGAPKKPVEFKSGEHQCEYCNMGIVDMRFRSEVITRKGKIHYFDSIECMQSWAVMHKEQINSAWVGNYANKGKWINFNKAFILQSDTIKSPMGANLSAYKTSAELKTDQAKHQGIQLNSQELEAFLTKWKRRATPRQPN